MSLSLSSVVSTQTCSLHPRFNTFFVWVQIDQQRFEETVGTLTCTPRQRSCDAADEVGRQKILPKRRKEEEEEEEQQQQNSRKEQIILIKMK